MKYNQYTVAVGINGYPLMFVSTPIPETLEDYDIVGLVYVNQRLLINNALRITHYDMGLPGKPFQLPEVDVLTLESNENISVTLQVGGNKRHLSISYLTDTLDKEYMEAVATLILKNTL